MNKLFDGIKPFDWEELDGKTLQIRAGKHEGAMVVVGYDQETKDIYVLHEEISTPPVPTIKPGDKVQRKTINIKGEVVKIRTIVNVREDDGFISYVPIEDLEVVE